LRTTRLVRDTASYNVNPVQASLSSPRMFQTSRQSEQQERMSDDVLCFDLKWRQGPGKSGSGSWRSGRDWGPIPGEIQRWKWDVCEEQRCCASLGRAVVTLSPTPPNQGAQ
jgi:hypothetical protein